MIVHQVHRYDGPRARRFMKRSHNRKLRRLSKLLHRDCPKKATRGWWY